MIWSSSVGVAALVAGIPVECEDGAAWSLYRHGAEPGRDERAAFLHRLAWFNWRPREAADAWQWMRRLTAEAGRDGQPSRTTISASSSGR